MQGLLTLLTFLSPFITTQKNMFTKSLFALFSRRNKAVNWDFP